MSKTKRELYNEKLTNLMIWIREIKDKDDIKFGDDHLLLIKLNELRNEEKFIQFLIQLNSIADTKDEISDSILTLFLKEYNVDINKYNIEDIIKFKKYLKFFTKISRI